MKLFALAITLLSCYASTAHGVEIVPTGQVAGIGDAYSKERETFIGSRCISGAENTIGVASSTLSLDQSLSQNQAEDSLGFSAGGRARYGVVEGSASANFVSRSLSNEFSISSIYSAEYTFRQRKLTEPQLNAIGERVSGNPERWRISCGSSYVSEIKQGAKFFFSIKIDFKSKEEKQDFSAKFDISGPAAGVNGTLQQASKTFSKRTKITVSVLQIGGDVQKISGIFLNDVQGRTAYLECTLGSFDSCAKVLSNALAYATDTSTGFPSQLNQQENRADLVYVITPYDSAGIFEGPPPFFDDIVTLKRTKLNRVFEEQYAKRRKLTALRNVNPLPPRSIQLDEASKLIDKNLNVVYTAAKSCYDNANTCSASADNLEVLAVNEEVFSIPSLQKLCEYAHQTNNDKQIFFMNALAWVSGRLKRVPPDNAYPSVQEIDLCGGIDDVKKMRYLVDFGATVNLSMDTVLAAGGIRYELSDINLLQAGTGIQQLHMLGHSISNIDVINLLENLNWLELGGNRIKDVSALKGLDQLRILSLNNNSIRDLSPLSGLHNLEILQVRNNIVEDVSDFKDLPRVHILDLDNNQIKKIDALSQFTNLDQLYVQNNNIASLSGFSPNKLKLLKIEDNPLPVTEIADFCRRSRSTRVDFSAFPGTYGNIVVSPTLPDDAPRKVYKYLECAEVK